MNAPVLILPGIGNSGPQHWQTLWQDAHPDFVRVRQRDWDRPVCVEWVMALDAAVRASGPQTVLVAHSLGCLAVAHWAALPHAPLKAALLVAVPDPAGANFPAEASGFAATPTPRFDFASTVVASSDDPYGSPAHAARLAAAWGSRFVEAGAGGHLNAASGLGDWPTGWSLLEALRRG